MKQDPVPYKLKDAIKVRTVPLQARMSKPVVLLADADAPPADEKIMNEEPSHQDDNESDSAVYDYLLPSLANSALIQYGSPALDVKFPFEYRAIQE
jgi:hypothetical protein